MINIVTTTLNYLNCGLKECIDALYKNTPTIFHYTIIDQGSNDGTLEWLQSMQSIYKYDILAFIKNRGVSAAHNYVWRNYPGEHYVKLDPDVVIQDKNWLSDMVKIADENKDKVGAIALNLEPIKFKPMVLSGIQTEIKETGNLGGACILVPNYINSLIGYWDEFLQPYGEEDAALGVRIHKLGRLNVYLPERATLLNNESDEYRNFKKTCRNANLKSGSDYHSRVQGYYGGKSLKVE